MQTLLIAPLYFRNHELSILESSLPGVTSIEVSTFLVKWLLRRVFKKCLTTTFNNSESSPLKSIVALHFSKIESPLFSDAWCQVWLD